ncbi:MAG: hypothetical protein PHW65_04020 [Dehalococcoidales bacterium]|nr:hypothetical protein [Dehalococcoidales bacterium]
MYEEYLGEGYHETARLILGADQDLLPNSIVDADLNISAMKMMMAAFFEQKPMTVMSKITEAQDKLITKAALYYLAAVLCVALKSRTAVPPFNTFRYKKDWEKKRKKCADKGNKLLMRVLLMG